MQGWHDTVQVILQILSNPSWSGISSLCSLIGIPLAIHLARKSKTTLPTHSRIPNIIKKISETHHLPIIFSLRRRMPDS
jgi:hypothetical protein